MDLTSLDTPADRWFSPTTPISFGSMKQLVVEGFDGYPQPRNIRIEQFESLESLKLVGETGRLLKILRRNGDTIKRVLPVPFLSHLEHHQILPERGFPFEALTKTLRERKEAGYGSDTVRIVGKYGKCSIEVAPELTKFVGVLMLDWLPDSMKNRCDGCTLSSAQWQRSMYQSLFCSILTTFSREWAAPWPLYEY